MTMLLRLGAVLVLSVLGFAVFSFYEARYLGLFPLGEVPPKHDLYHFVRSIFALVFSFLIVRTVHRYRAPECALDHSDIPSGGRVAALLVLTLALACTLFFWLDPVRFGVGAQEDSAVEWLSALLLLGGSMLFARLFVLHRASRAAALPALLFAIILFVIGMEEISWLQRVIGFHTPAELARANMQQEFNLHNVHTDLSENLYYIGAGSFLILLPFLRDALPASYGRSAWLLNYIPSRWVSAVSAPLSIFNYGMWNVIPMQMTMMLTVFVMAWYARAAQVRGARAEAALFSVIALAVIAGQATFVAGGHLLPNIWDASEYKEFFIALGLAAWAGDMATRAKFETPMVPPVDQNEHLVGSRHGPAEAKG